MKALLFFGTAFLFWTCANVTTPTGGPKDETPPKLLSSIPKQGQTNYPGRGVTLEFDELLKLKNPKEEIIITPAVKDPKFVTKKNLFLIEFPEKLADNTTYSISFREAIQDMNEGNPVNDLHLAFSTGNIIDSLKIEGTVNQLMLGIPAEKYTVAVYSQDTFKMFKHKPVYFTRTDKEGKFTLTNLKANKYFIYAWDDKNKNLSLESQSEKFGYLPTEIQLDKNVDSVKINSISLDSRPITIAGIRSLGHFTKVRLNKSAITYTLKSLDPVDKKINNSFSGSQAEIDIFPNKPAGDSTLITLHAQDSLNQTIDTTFYIKQSNAKSLKEPLKLGPSKIELQEESHKLTGKLALSELIRKATIDSIYIRIDSAKVIPFTEQELYYDTIRKIILLEKSFNKKDSINWQKARLIFGKSAFISIFGDSSKQTASSISVIKSDDRAILIVESTKIQANVILQVINEKYEVIASQRQSKTNTFKNLPASTLMLRALYDDNKNDKWDTGNPNQKTLPEEIIYYVNDKKKKQIPLRANWEVSIKWKF